MTTISLPTLIRKNATSAAFSLEFNTQLFESPLNKSVQTYELPGARWNFTATWNNLFDDDYYDLKAFILKCKGRAGRFYASDLAHKTLFGSAVGSGRVNGDAQTGRTVNAIWTDSVITADSSVITADSSVSLDAGYGLYNENWLKSGDYFNLNDELKMITQSTDMNDWGEVTLNFEPPVRAEANSHDPITVTDPKAVFMLTSDNIDKAVKKEKVWSPVTITGVEVF